MKVWKGKQIVSKKNNHQWDLPAKSFEELQLTVLRIV